MIETLSLRNFKVLRNVDVRLRPLTLIVGPNGSGKSSLLLALAQALGSLGTLPLVGENSPSVRPSLDSIDFKSRLPDGPVQLRIVVKLGSRSWDLNLVEGSHFKLNGDDPSAFREENYFPALLNLDLKSLAAPSLEQRVIQALAPDGSGLAWVLAGLHLEAHSQFKEIVKRLQAVVPTVQDLRIKRKGLGPETVGYELLFDMKGGEGIPAQFVSEGTLLTLALLVLLAGPNPPGLVLIENLERGLHPKALQDLVLQIRSLQEQNPRLQIVATSHSPYLLDFVEADEILLTSLDEEGYASVRPLSEHPEYDRWKDVMAPGEFWSTVGESWVVQKT
jgi:predicted ATPase